MQRFTTIMKALLALVIAALVTACGGGGSAPPTTPTPEAAGPWVRYQATWTGNHYSTTGSSPPATLSVAPLPGDASIASNAVARVEVQLGQAVPVALTAPNSTDAQGRPQFMFDFGQLTGPGIPTVDCSPNLQIRITVVDVTGFSFVKNMTTCRAGVLQFGAFSDYGSTAAAFSFSALWALDAVVTHRSPAGDVLDSFNVTSPPAFSTTLSAGDGDTMDIRTYFPRGGATVTARIEGGGGTFAESVGGGLPPPPEAPFVLLQCCGTRSPGGGTVDAALRLNGVPARADATYTYTLRITNPTTGAIVLSKSDTASALASIPVQVSRGDVVEVDATPNAADMYVESSITLGRPYDSAYATSNRADTPARFRVVCCAP